MFDFATLMTPAAYLFLSTMSLFLLILPFRYAIIPIIVSICYMTLGQEVIIIDLHFSIIRILILIGFIRLMMRGEFYKINLNVIDKTLIWWVIVSIITATLLEPTTSTIINRLGFAYNAIGAYFLFRILIRDYDSINIVFKTLAIIIFPLAILMIIEKFTARNLFSVFGGVPEFTAIREGRLRCQGPFNHPILAGTFGVSILPFFVAFWFQETGKKFIAFIGVLSATIITIASASSGPVVAYIFGIAGFIAWRFRRHMRAIRWTIILGLIGLQLFMKAPVWYLLGRLSEVIGGTGYHRSEIITQAISHFGDWWLFGTNYTADWMPYHLDIDPNSTDMTNQYILEGVTGGLLKLILFIIIIILCFKTIGRIIHCLENEKFAVRITLWSMGVSLLIHTVSFFSVAYFDQMIVIFYMLLAMISGSSIFLLKKEEVLPDTSELNPET